MKFMQRELMNNGGSRTAFLAGDVRDLPFRQASFDKVLALEVIEHIPSEAIARYLRDIRRVLTARGMLFLTTPNYRSYWPALEYLMDQFGRVAEMGQKQHVTRFNANRLRAALEANGFKVLQEGTVYHLSPFISPLFPDLAEYLFRMEIRKGRNLGPILFSLAVVATETQGDTSTNGIYFTGE
jgi:2-polyprenyl-3-methyl-5-hydroxy-6-metoxy-1,4-benzoquinol methylase